MIISAVRSNFYCTRALITVVILNFFFEQIQRIIFGDLTFFLSLAIVLLTVYLLTDYIRIAFVALQTPGPPGHPLIGNSFLVIEKDCE